MGHGRAVQIALGSNNEPLDLHPGNTWHSNILASSIYSNTGTCNAREAGVYNPSTSSSLSTFTTVNSIEQIDWTAGALPMTGTHIVQFDTATIIAADRIAQGDALIPALSLSSYRERKLHAPKRNKVCRCGWNIGIGNARINQSYPQIGQTKNFNASLVFGYLYETNQIRSNFYGLHIGSAAAVIPGSAFVGGYDQSCVLGQVTAQSYALYSLSVDLLDVGFGVALDLSPFLFPSRSGLLAEGISTIGTSLLVLIEATILLPLPPIKYMQRNRPFSSRYLPT